MKTVLHEKEAFLGSSAVERRPVKAMVVGSIPTRGADIDKLYF